MERAPVRAPLIKNLDFKVGLLLALTLLLAVAFLVYTLYVRGAFERTQKLTLVTENAEGVEVGMPMSYAGFPIGQVKRLTLADNGQVRIELRVPAKDAKWLRESSVFTLEKSILGSAKIRAYTNLLTDAALKDGAERPLYTGDAAAEIPQILARVKDILANINGMTAADSSLNQSLANVKTVTARMSGENGIAGSLLGSEENVRKLTRTLDSANTMLTSLNGASLKLDKIFQKTDRSLFSDGGVMPETQKAAVQINAILADVRESLKKADAILANGETISADVKGATEDIGVLRAQVDDSLAKVNHLINEINRKWPFKRDVEVTLP